MAKILIVDDDKSILTLLKLVMKQAGHDVIITTDGTQALAQTLAEKPDLIVADVMMPKMTGYEFCKRIRANPETKNIPVIMFSARFQPIDRQTALEAGATDYLSKTIAHSDLVKRIEELLASSLDPDEVTNTTIGFLSLRGGTGVTSLAVNSAIALARAKKIETALVDLIPLGGHVALMLGLRPTSNVMSALSSADNILTLDAIKAHFIQHNGIQLLASAVSYEQKLPLQNNRLQQLVAVLKSAFPFVIFDLPATILDPLFASFLRQFDKIVLVFSPDMPSLQSTAIAFQGLAQMQIPESKIMLVANQVMPQGSLSVDTIQKAIKRPIAAYIPFEPDMITAINSRSPLLLSSPKSTGAGAIARLASML